MLSPKEVSGSGFTPKLDGRRLRGARTKQRVIDALLELVREGNPDPRTCEIAERAGCVVRSIFDHFVAIDNLHSAAAEYAIKQAVAFAPLVDADADRQTRIAAQVHTRAGTCERALPLWRLLLARQSKSSELREKVAVARKLIGLRLEAIYAPELATMAEAARLKLVVALEALTNFESWELMRDYHKMSFEDACDVWIGAIDRLLPSAPTPRS
jgi:AcrR family transcriptional regulator